ncbi:ROK family protein [Bdellovibrionota bacterium FG-2]
MTQKVVLAYDLGGTKVAVGAVNGAGKVLEEVRLPVGTARGKTAVIQQLANLGKGFMSRFPAIKVAGIASAGPLDPVRGVLLDPTNFGTPTKGTWGEVPLAQLLEKKLGIRVRLENDAAAAILAEHWKGAARGFDNAMILTLGTGLGTGVIANGTLVRAGRNMHTEAGHVILNYQDLSAPCGCGNFGCAEAYLSGRNFALRYQKKNRNSKITAPQIADQARRGDRAALQAFEEYAQAMAVAIASYVVLYAPEIVVFTGSFAETADLFLEKTQINLQSLLQRRREGIDFMPQLVVSSLNNQAGLIGGAYVALHRKG